jgi:hypothetical protein
LKRGDYEEAVAEAECAVNIESYYGEPIFWDQFLQGVKRWDGR